MKQNLLALLKHPASNDRGIFIVQQFRSVVSFAPLHVESALVFDDLP